ARPERIRGPVQPARAAAELLKVHSSAFLRGRRSGAPRSGEPGTHEHRPADMSSDGGHGSRVPSLRSGPGTTSLVFGAFAHCSSNLTIPLQPALLRLAEQAEQLPQALLRRLAGG